MQNCRKALCTEAALLALSVPGAAQIDPKAALVERAAWVALTAGRAPAAAEAFREAIAADPKNARLHLGAGMAAALERRDGDALDAVQRALALDPRLVEAQALLGQIQYRMGDAPAAIRTYQRLVASAPGDRGARATLDRWRREAELHERLHQTIGASFSFDAAFLHRIQGTFADFQNGLLCAAAIRCTDCLPQRHGAQRSRLVISVRRGSS